MKITLKNYLKKKEALRKYQKINSNRYFEGLFIKKNKKCLVALKMLTILSNSIFNTRKII